MLKTIRMIILPGLFLLLNASVNAQQTQNQESKKEKNMQQIVIDQAIVPGNAKEEFMKRMNRSRDLIRKQPGLIKEEAYENTDASGNMMVITTVIWENEEALQNARHTIQAEYNLEGFDLPAFCQRLNIKIERGIYHTLHY